MATPKKSTDDPDKDPYQVLEIPFSATEADVTKGYRKLALKYHPDKQKGDLTEQQIENVAQKFQEIQAARDFLLDAEKRRKYDAKRASSQARKLADEAREQQMSAKRKRMRDQLSQQEKAAAASQKQKIQRPTPENQKTRQTANVEELRRQGREMRESMADRRHAKSAKAAVKEQEAAATAAINLENRQIRLKWSRKRMKISPSEHDIAHLMTKFGKVDQVEMLGSKGNAALVTFYNETSCAPCVQAYLDSEEMRAAYVGGRKEQEARKKLAQDEKEKATESRSSTTEHHRTESVRDYKLRRAAEREQVLRQMEAEEGKTASAGPASADRSTESTKPHISESFPAKFPATEEFRKQASPYQKLLLAEEQILSTLLS